MADPWSAQPWEGVSRSGWASDEDTAEPSFDDVSKEEAEEQLALFLVFLKRSGILSAKQVCIIAFWSQKAGVKGLVEAMTVEPNGAHFSRTFDKAVAPTESGVIDKYDLKVPSYRRADDTLQAAEWIPMHLPLDCARADLENDASMPRTLQDSVADGELPLRYFQHPVTRSAPAGVPVYPYSLYFDGVPFTRQDGLLCCYLTNLLTETVHCLVTLRKSEACGCGCRGWCTVYVVLKAIGWGLSHAGPLGCEPRERHDGTSWLPSDGCRGQRSGERLAFRVDVLFCVKRPRGKRDHFGLASVRSWRPPVRALLGEAGGVGEVRRA